MRNYYNSLCYACEGLLHAMQRERNLKLFVAGYVVTIIAGFVFRLSSAEWIGVLLSGGTFLAIELLNTALERFSDAFDAHSKKQDDACAGAIKVTKDVAAGAALISAVTWVICLGLSFWPHL